MSATCCADPAPAPNRVNGHALHCGCLDCGLVRHGALVKAGPNVSSLARDLAAAAAQNA